MYIYTGFEAILFCKQTVPKHNYLYWSVVNVHHTEALLAL